MSRRKRSIHKIAEKIYREIRKRLLLQEKIPERYIVVMSDASLSDFEGRIGFWVFIKDRTEAHLFITKQVLSQDSNETEMVAIAYATTLIHDLIELFHLKPEAIFVFTDNASAVEYIDGTKPYVPENYRTYYEIIKTNSLRDNIQLVWLKNTKNELADALSRKNFTKAFEIMNYLEEYLKELETLNDKS